MKHLIFDIGGVFVYPRLGEWNIPLRMKEILGARADSMNTDTYRRACERAVVWLDESRLVKDTDEEYSLREKYIRDIDRDMDWRLSENEIALIADDFTRNIDRYGFYDDVRPWLARWKEAYSMGVLSDAMPSILVYLEQYGIRDMFDAVTISCHEGVTKPGEKMYAAILSALKAEPGDCVFIDDRACNLEGAAKMGIRGVQMARAEFMPERLWDGPIVHNFEELNAILGELF